jgi:hypothetical protein
MFSYKKFKQTDFYHFFNITEASKTKLDSKSLLVKLKTGAHQQHIEIILTLTESSQIKNAKLLLNQRWIGNEKNINPLSTDISKSFIVTFFPFSENNTLRLLIHYLFNLRGENDWYNYCQRKCLSALEESVGDEIKQFLNIYRGSKGEIRLPIQGRQLIMKHLGTEKNKLLIECKL